MRTEWTRPHEVKGPVDLVSWLKWRLLFRHGRTEWIVELVSTFCSVGLLRDFFFFFIKMLYQMISDEWSLVLWQLSWHAVTLKQVFRLLKLSSPFSQTRFLCCLQSPVLKIWFYPVWWEPSRSPEDSDHVQYSVEYGERRWRLERRDDALFHWINILHWDGPAARYSENN